MRIAQLALLGMVAAAVAGGCRFTQRGGEADTSGSLPPNTVELSTMMQALSAQPGFTEAFLQQVDGPNHKAGAALLTPELIHELRERILGKDWQGLDRFPGWTMGRINPTVRVVGHFAGRDQSVSSLATAGGAPAGPAGSAAAKQAVTAYMDLGELKLDRGGTLSLNQPSTGKGFVTSEYVSQVGDGVTRGDDGNPELTPIHADSARLAEVLNRLSLNGIEGAAPFTAEVGGRTAANARDLIANMAAAGAKITVADSRYFANFGHLHFKQQDVMMPFWINSEIVVPHTNRPLLVPVSHAEYEWFVRDAQGQLQEAVSFYFGIDGKAEWRTMDQLDQRWVMNHLAHEYTGADALEVTRLTAAMVQTYAHEHQARPKLPFGGYYALGVCQDVVAAIELKMTGTTTLFPNTADAKLFTDPRDGEINGLIRRIPKDRNGRPPQVARVLGSLPVGDSDEELAKVSVPGLGPDLVAVHDAWTQGTLRRVRPRWERWGSALATCFGLLVGLLFLFWVRRRKSA